MIHPTPIRSRAATAAGLAIAVVALAACGQPEAEGRYRPVADVQELMYHVVEPAAQTYWKAVGWIIDADGEQYIHPQSEEEWIAVENAAFVVAESGNLLLMGDRALDDEGWVAMSQSLVDIGERALRAAEAMDEQAVFDLGAEMYYVCSNCHARYSPEVLRPNDDRSVPIDEGEPDEGAADEGA